MLPVPSWFVVVACVVVGWERGWVGGRGGWGYRCIVNSKIVACPRVSFTQVFRTGSFRTVVEAFMFQEFLARFRLCFSPRSQHVPLSSIHFILVGPPAHFR